MDTVPLYPPKKKLMPSGGSTASGASRLLTLQAMVPIAANLAASQLEAFAGRLADALFKVSDQAVRPDEAATSFQAFQLLKRNTSTFYRLVAGQIHVVLTREVGAINAKKKPASESNTKELQDFSLVSFDEMEGKVLVRNLSQTLELLSSAQLVALNARIGYVLETDPIDIAHNPFRPEMFVRAVHQAWMEFDEDSASHHLVLRLLQPDLFLQLTPILQEVNEVLAERGILANIPLSHRSGQRKTASSTTASLTASDPYLRNKLNRLLQTNPQANKPASAVARSPVAGHVGHAGLSGGLSPGYLGSVLEIDRQFFDYLTSIQAQRIVAELESSVDASALRQLMQHEYGENLSAVDQNTIELLARIFEFVFNDPGIPEDLKNLIGDLQIPTLKAALLDKEFFFSDSHPARVLIDTLAKSSIFLDMDSSEADPLYQVIEDIVERVQQEFDQQIDLFSDVVADLENFLKEEEIKTQQAISQPVADALKAEKKRLAREFADNDVALRGESGEVAGFLESFLQNQWARILAIGHEVKEDKPEALENALRTMDDLIWSLKPKNSAEERKALVSKLPAMLSLLNAWLNAIKWDEPARVEFFSKLAERHAAIARSPLELSPRRQIEIAVNIAQRASERQFVRNASDKYGQADDSWWEVVQAMEQGIWVDIVRNNGVTARFKLSWVSPKRTRFIFTNRQGHDAFSISAEELLVKLRDGTAVQIVAASVVDRALLDALRDSEA